jgi:hypothetical protein
VFVCFLCLIKGDKVKTAKIKNVHKPVLKPTTILLTKEHHDVIRRIAKERKMTISNVIRGAVLDIIEDDEDIKEIMKARREEKKNYISLEDYHKARAEKEGKYKVLLSPESKQTLDGLPSEDAKELIDVIRSLGENPRPKGAKRLVIPE